MNLKTILSRIFFVIGAFLITLLIIKVVPTYHSSNDNHQKFGKDIATKEKSDNTDKITTPIKQPVFLEFTTPHTQYIDYEFNIESDDPIDVKLPGVSETQHYPGKGKMEFPPWEKGNVNFTDPANGHKTFRIYRLN